ncbi:ferrochelatase [Microlunatus sp. Gsoil 973]|uniref:ferrochelatase n=1 Tax=Microlunatus sp. Gsoil 973 TaxID=2672569 RepID=UPI0012B4DC60|nr:ferrochelatase [Microlunatus sp. Gsoil 973]QGN32931.1 ferrochelatase [Microlunatus sp. Gsoil 973]
MSTSDPLEPYDAVVLVSFGGPERPEDVVPFLRNVTQGRGIPDERLAEVGEHYYRFGGRSPINDQCRALIAALRTEFDGQRIDTPIYWGNRNWEPYLADTFLAAEADGHRRLLVITTSAYPSYSSCRQYRENLYDAAGSTALQIDRIRQYADHPGFATASVDAVLAGLDQLQAAGHQPESARLVYVTHSIPTAMSDASEKATRGYVSWHNTVADEITRRVSETTGVGYRGDLVYCSRSGAPGQPWLEPDINDHLAVLTEQGVGSVVVVPIGFISDHMEVIYDLDTEAAETAQQLGLGFARAATAGTHPAFVSALVDLMRERAAAARGERPDRAVISGAEVGAYLCPTDCCVNLRQPDRPALCQA